MSGEFIVARAVTIKAPQGRSSRRGKTSCADGGQTLEPDLCVRESARWQRNRKIPAHDGKHGRPINISTDFISRFVAAASD